MKCPNWATIVISVCEKGSESDHALRHSIVINNIHSFSQCSLSRLTPDVDEITGDQQCGF